MPRLFRSSAAISLMLLILSLAIWESSYWVCVVHISRGSPQVVIGEWAGGFGGWIVPPAKSPTFTPCGWSIYRVHSAEFWSRPWARPRVEIAAGRVVIPYWLTAILFSILPAWFIICRAAAAYQKARPAKPTGLCVNCGYDLRATPDRCPECGTAPPL